MPIHKGGGMWRPSSPGKPWKLGSHPYGNYFFNVSDRYKKHPAYAADPRIRALNKSRVYSMQKASFKRMGYMPKGKSRSARQQYSRLKKSSNTRSWNYIP